MKSITHFLIIISLIVLFENNSKANEFITIIVEDITKFLKKPRQKKYLIQIRYLIPFMKINL